jgi:Flp pilus assembly pilin Flp
MKRYWNYLKNNRKGQGTTEYVVILAFIITMVIMFFPKISAKISGKSEKIANMIETGHE